MSNKNKLSPGLIVELGVQEGEYVGKYRTRIEEVGERLLLIGAPYDKGEIVPLREGMKVKLTFWDEVAAYSFESKIMQRIAVPIPLFVLELPNSFTKVQRRSFVRVPAFFPVSFRLVTREGLSDLKKAVMLDLSGGGLRFTTTENLEKNSLLFAHISLPSGELQIPVRVCRSEKIDDSKKYSISVEFHDLSERDRDRIIRCVFDLQRAMRKKGLV